MHPVSSLMEMLCGRVEKVEEKVCLEVVTFFAAAEAYIVLSITVINRFKGSPLDFVNKAQLLEDKAASRSLWLLFRMFGWNVGLLCGLLGASGIIFDSVLGR